AAECATFVCAGGTCGAPLDAGTSSPDGGGVLPDGGGVLPDGGVVLPDGGVVLPDGGVVLPDGGILLADGGVVRPLPDGGFAPVGPSAYAVSCGCQQAPSASLLLPVLIAFAV